MIRAAIPTYFVESKAELRRKHNHVDARHKSMRTRFDRRKHTQVDFNSRQFTAET